MQPVSAWDLVRDTVASPVLSFGCDGLDYLLGGGLRKGITELCGEAGVGKTQLALQLLLQVQLPIEEGGLEGNAFFLSTEGEVPIARLSQLQDAFKQKHPWTQNFDFLQHVFLARVQTLEEQEEIVMKRLPLLLSRQNVKLVVIDSIAALLRVEFSADQSIERAEHMFSLAAQLKHISHSFNCIVLVTNQVTDLFLDNNNSNKGPSHYLWRQSVPSQGGRRVVPALGLAWASCVDTRLAMSRTETRRLMHVLRAVHVPNDQVEFVVEQQGVRGVEFQVQYEECEEEPEVLPLPLRTTSL